MKYRVVDCERLYLLEAMINQCDGDERLHSVVEIRKDGARKFVIIFEKIGGFA